MKRFDTLEAIMTRAYDTLGDWVKRYVTHGAEPTELELPKTFEPDQDKAKEFFDSLVYYALTEYGFKKSDVDLGPKEGLS